jgi:hypothetical protein
VPALFRSLGLYFSCYFLCYLPVFRADSLEVEEAMAADPFSPEVCRRLARSELELLLHGSPEALGLGTSLVMMLERGRKPCDWTHFVQTRTGS